MTTRLEPVSASEFILRRVHKNHCAAQGPQIILPAGFRPCPADQTGLSLFRESRVSAAEVAARGRKPEELFVVRLPVEALLRLGLSVIPEESEEDGPGHVVIPELSWSAYQKNKTSLKVTLVELARLANEAIVISPA